jgi:ribosomal protein S18 acetylase RimI-like enzyme
MKLFMTDLEILLDETGNTAFKNPIIQGVRAYNFPYLGAWESKPFTFYIKDSDETIIAGAFGRYIPYELVEIDCIWVEEKYRKQKLGARIAKAVEDFAKNHGAKCINLYTMDFQAVGFYKTLGFVLLAIIPKWAKDYDAHFMRKVL